MSWYELLESKEDSMFIHKYNHLCSQNFCGTQVKVSQKPIINRSMHYQSIPIYVHTYVTYMYSYDTTSVLITHQIFCCDAFRHFPLLYPNNMHIYVSISGFRFWNWWMLSCCFGDFISVLCIFFIREKYTYTRKPIVRRNTIAYWHFPLLIPTCIAFVLNVFVSTFEIELFLTCCFDDLQTVHKIGWRNCHITCYYDA